MTRPLHPGRPGTRILPADWQAQVAPVVSRVIDESGVTVTIRSTTTGTGSHWDNELGRTVTTGSGPVYTGAATLSMVTDAQVIAAEDAVDVHTYLIQLPVATAGVRRGQQVTVDTDPDGELAGRTLTVVTVEHDTRRLSRSLYATLDD